MEPYSHSGPRIKILEQPSQSVRFRYLNEGRNGGPVVGCNSTPEHKTFVRIQLINYTGRAIVVVSCVSDEGPRYRPHPHKLVGRVGCKGGICSMEFTEPHMIMEFKSLGIQCVLKKEVESSLQHRLQINVDPYRTGFEHRFHTNAINLRAVRLCFQVFLENPIERGLFNVCTVPPEVTNSLLDERTIVDLNIVKLSHCNSLAVGGQQIILLCRRVVRDDICVRFYDENNPAWESFGIFQPEHVHRQVAISFITPPYHNLQIDNPVLVKIQLYRKSDQATGEPLNFEYLPSYMNPGTAKRPRLDLTLLNELTNFDENFPSVFAVPSTSRSMSQDQNMWNPSSILNQTMTTATTVNRITNVSSTQTDDLLMSIFNNTSVTDYDPTDSFSDIK